MIVINQLPVEHWRKTMANPTITDALLDRLVQPAYRIELKVLRKHMANQTD